ncbi:hypothetical protein [Pseudoalteromonas maricaloris]|uniref:hypothetical protein n=1 Tax=Pseudoalteromonas maricaloris TaxID=184924 RepID=UPI00057D3954|nr:hypothetical protein [Pseudoalteromonas flavipulchra]KID34801.1 hypothetical protein QT15_17045 [Pseudoalteromonas flavipulchra NCIMB 2033 = ATCC BAA-314]MBD0781276.1 hypothetical protein [Pseudoalteromonas flavipulchra]MBE0372845.1 hypothetical protein [Pseudoalteromonas flavipulchra NCIMB 2033 = ATCC BAA-314]
MSLKSPADMLCKIFMDEMPSDFYSSLSANASDSEIRRLICGVSSSPSLSKTEKKQVFNNLSSLSRFQITELIKVFDEESSSFSALTENAPEEVSELVGYSTATWLLTFDESLSNKISIYNNDAMERFFDLCRSAKYQDRFGVWTSNGYYWAGFIKALTENNECEKITYPLKMLKQTLNDTNLHKNELISLTKASSGRAKGARR